MSRFNLSLALGVMLVSSVPSAWAQINPYKNGMDSISSAGIAETRMVDLTMPSVNDPAAVDMLFKEGNTILSVLQGLKEKGFHIRFKEKHFRPTMTLLSLPKSTSIDDVLREILEPWNFKVYRSPLGPWIVTPTNKKVSRTPDDEAHEKLIELINGSPETK